MAAGDYVLRLGNITSLSMSDINGDDATPQSRPGTITFINNVWGYAILKYVRAVAAVTQGGLLSRYGLTTTQGNTIVSNITSGTTTTATKSAAWAANAEVGAIFYVQDNDDAAGAAPEGEMSIVAANTANVLTLDSRLPMSVALAANDDVTTIATYQMKLSQDGDLNQVVQGIAIGKNGISAGQYGWIQMEGYGKARAKASTTTIQDPIVADVGVVGPFGTDGQELHIGQCVGTFTSDNAATTMPVNMKCFTPASSATAP
jgi:hypothetical protein